MYGYETKSLDDPCIKAADEAVTLAASLLLPGNLVNIFPILARIPSWVPGTDTVRNAAHVRRWLSEVKRIPMEFAKKRVVSSHPESVARRMKLIRHIDSLKVRRSRL